MRADALPPIDYTALLKLSDASRAAFSTSDHRDLACSRAFENECPAVIACFRAIMLY